MLKTSISDLSFFAQLSDDCAAAPDTKSHKAGRTSVLAGLASMGIEGRDEVPGRTPGGERWDADVLFFVPRAHDRDRVATLHLRDFTRLQERYSASSVECYWLVRKEIFRTLSKATARLLLNRDFGDVFPDAAIGTGTLAELPIAMLDPEQGQMVLFGGLKTATVSSWLVGVVNGTYQYRGGSWNLG
ncbi:hypothetical protein [Cupriavidus malaysiensis]|uniref:hypothetical protein n=1 Tax=Cupriavidus malaysiensis TaxID=367825 RepID=UPI001F46C4A6|nr:hypothetical protein [Cupriavidus malaysiensis]